MHAHFLACSFRSHRSALCRVHKKISCLMSQRSDKNLGLVQKTFIGKRVLCTSLFARDVSCVRVYYIVVMCIFMRRAHLIVLLVCRPKHSQALQRWLHHSQAERHPLALPRQPAQGGQEEGPAHGPGAHVVMGMLCYMIQFKSLNSPSQAYQERLQ